jgi:hypothetical protein
MESSPAMMQVVGKNEEGGRTRQRKKDSKSDLKIMVHNI